MADISKLELPNGSEYDIKDTTARSAGVYYGTCSTGGGTVAKVATVTGVTELKTGLTVAIKFTAANTVANPTLNVNSLGAKAIKRYGTTAPSTSAASSWNANSVVTLTYDGTYWMLHDWNNTTYSSMSVAEYEAGTSTSARVITPARLKAAIETHAPVSSVNGATGDVTITETDPTVPSWAKASTKPSYTASEVGAVPTTRTINGHALSADVTLVEGLTPLIGASSSITPTQVSTALGEGRAICITHSGSLAGVNLTLSFTNWNKAIDSDYDGQAINVVVSQTIAVYNSSYYLFELVGVEGLWNLFTTTIAEASSVTTAYNLADQANTTANTALSGVNGSYVYDQTFTITNGVATFTPHVYLKGAEVTTDFATTCFSWKYRLIDGSEVTLATKSDRGCDVTITSMGYGGHVIGAFTPA